MAVAFATFIIPPYPTTTSVLGRVFGKAFPKIKHASAWFSFLLSARFWNCGETCKLFLAVLNYILNVCHVCVGRKSSYVSQEMRTNRGITCQKHVLTLVPMGLTRRLYFNIYVIQAFLRFSKMNLLSFQNKFPCLFPFFNLFVD